MSGRMAWWMAIAAFGMSSAMAAPVAPVTDEPVEKEVVLSIGDAYIPSGLDSGSDAFVVVNGLYFNGCYRWKRAEVKSDVAARLHEVKSIATVRPGMCINVLIPFTQEVRIGKLGRGEHTIRFLNGDGTYIEKSMRID